MVLGTSLSGAQAAFVLTIGQPLPLPAEVPATAGGSAEPAAEASTTAATAVTDDAATAGGGSAEQDDAAAQHERLRQRLAAAAAAAQARQRVSASVAAAAAAGNPALEAAAAAAASGAGLMQPPNVAKLRLWNPMTGHVVPVRDPSCELREVRGACAPMLQDSCWTASHMHTRGITLIRVEG